jgi:hypothetical protein
MCNLAIVTEWTLARCLVLVSVSVLANAFTFGGTDALGWTDSASYEGSQYTVSRVTATVARETAITAATLGIGTAARGGSAAAQAAYKGILVVEAATGGYQIGKGAGQIAEGDYEAGALNVVAGGLRVGGSIVSAGAIAPKSTSELSREAQKGIRSLENRIAEHETKLANFKANPTVRPGMENLPEEIIKKQQQARIQHLENELQTFRNNIEKLRQGGL